MAAVDLVVGVEAVTHSERPIDRASREEDQESVEVRLVSDAGQTCAPRFVSAPQEGGWNDSCTESTGQQEAPNLVPLDPVFVADSIQSPVMVEQGGLVELAVTELGGHVTACEVELVAQEADEPVSPPKGSVSRAELVR